MILAAIKEQRTADSLFKRERQDLIKIIDSTITGIDAELSNLVNVKSKSSRFEREALDEQIDVLNLKKDILLVKKDQLLNTFNKNREDLTQETDSLLLQNPEIDSRLLQNS